VAAEADSSCTKPTSAIAMSPPDTSAVEQTANEQLIKLQCIHSQLFLKETYMHVLLINGSNNILGILKWSYKTS
jgi:hypothetical protein